jgi:hypothetical protein
MDKRKGLKTKAYEDDNFVVEDSPVTHCVHVDLGGRGARGYIICDGPGDIRAEFSTDGDSDEDTWGDQHTIKSGEKFPLDGIDMYAIKITYVTDSAYRVMVF